MKNANSKTTAKSNKTIKAIQKQAKKELKQEIKKVFKPNGKQNPNQQLNQEFKSEMNKVFESNKPNTKPFTRKEKKDILKEHTDYFTPSNKKRMEKMTKDAKSKKKESEKSEKKASEKKITLKSIVLKEVPEMLKANKSGIKLAELINAILKIRTEATRNSVWGCIYSLLQKDWKGMLIIEKGIYKMKNGKVLDSKTNNKK